MAAPLPNEKETSPGKATTEGERERRHLEATLTRSNYKDGGVFGKCSM